MDTQLTQAVVERVNPLTDTILQVFLKPEPYIPYQAGQYLQIILGEDAFSYSIANAPLGSHQYELHIRHSPDNLTSQRLMAEIQTKGTLTIRLPFGDCEQSRLHPTKPLLFIAGGTGFAPIKAMIEQLLAEGNPRIFELFWSARSKSDLYMDEMVSHWQAHVRPFQYISLLSDTSKISMGSVILERHAHTIKDWQMVISGPFDMVYTLRDQMVACGVSPNNLLSDAFSFEGRSI
jgi:CDP-4-dehydro-6-deoxyglucose reductase